MSIIALDPTDPKKSPGYFQISRYLELAFREATASRVSSFREEMVSIKNDPVLNSFWNSGRLDIKDRYDRATVRIDDAFSGKSILTTQEHKEDYQLIEKVLFDDLKLSRNAMQYLKYKAGMRLLPGDVLLVKAPRGISKGRDEISFYSVVISQTNNSLYSFPEIAYGKTINNVSLVFRPTNIQGNEELRSFIDGEIGQLEEFKERSDVPQIQLGTPLSEPDGLLQIGDIKFLVSPTQISFVTQNGYHQFPTIRTRGNPKLPSMQEVKSVHITIIFPNEETINNQLLPLYAMYRRAPFINLYNKDICNFFSELRGPASRFIPVALESIGIESVTGFPNTVQATINLLPFQHKGVGNSFKALKSFTDVRAQQWFQEDKSDAILTDALERRLYNRTNNPRLPYLIKPPIQSTYNFEESEPFRSFYQALIAERNYVEDDRGHIVYKTKDASGKGEAISLESFRPTKEENKLHYYVTGHNTNRPVRFTYTYIPEDIRKFSARQTDSRDSLRYRIAEESKLLMDIMYRTDNPEFRNKIQSAFINRQDFFDQMQSRFMGSADLLNQYFSINNIDINQPEAKRINGLLEFLLEAAAANHPTIAWVMRSGGNRQGIINAFQTTSEAFLSGKATYNKQDEDVLGILRNVTVHAEGIGGVTPERLSNIIGLRIQEELGRVQNEEAKKRWADFFAMFFESLDGKTIDRKLSTMLTSALPLEEDQVVIDNIKDVIEGWSVHFANKFIPVNLQGFKYPFYQHIGSDDITMSLGIKSLQSGRDRGLKEQLSELNDRIQNSAKIVTYNAPELITDLDPRLHIITDVGAMGSIFNMFNIKYAVYNGSNVTNVPEQPNAWRINLSLSQANFTLRDYQNIQSIPNMSDAQDDIINLISRCIIDDSGNIVVNKYGINVNKLNYYRKTNKFTDIPTPEGAEHPYTEFNNIEWFGSATDSTAYGATRDNPLKGEALKKLNNDILGFSFYYNQWENIVSEASAEKLQKSNDVFNLVDHEILIRERSDSETKNINKMMRDKPELRLIFKNLITRLNQLHLTHVQILAKLFKKNQTFLQELKGRVNAKTIAPLLAGIALLVVVTVATGGAATGFLAGAMFTLIKTVGIGLVAGSLADIVGVPAADRMFHISEKREKLASEYQATIESIINGMKYSFIDKLANDIIRDPLVRKELFGDKYEDDVKTTYFDRGVNCYNDFDIPLGYRKEQGRYHQVKGTDIEKLIDLVFSPDFYLYNYDISKLEKDFYVNSSILQLQNIAKIASLQTLKENHDTLEQIQILDQTIFNGEVDEVRTKLLDDLEIGKSNSGYGSKSIANRLASLQRLYSKLSTNKKDSADQEDPDHLKFNLIRAARSKRLVQLKILQTATNLALSGYGDSDDDQRIIKQALPINFQDLMKNTNLATTLGVSSTDDLIKGSLLDSSLDSVKKMSYDINQFFIQYVNDDKEGFSGLASNRKLLSKPGSRKFEETVYTLLDQLVILSTALKQYEEGFREFDYLNEIPEIKMLEWFNWRLQEDANSSRIDLLSQFNEQESTNTRGSNARLFPTFKLYFVEEDGKTIKNMDDYYSYNAINSIDIVRNKESAGATAIIRLSNTMGHLTDKVSLMRETNSSYERIISNQDNLFLGTLDIKPGTKIIIKMGYHANDRFLNTVFVGRIIEMNPGPDTTMVCQSYGTQLNHHITKMNFGIRSSANEHGDIASIVLDAVPSLEGLGKPSLLNLNADKFTGKNLRQLDKNLFEKFMVSNLLNRINAGMFTQDNPRDNNIYLPYSLFPTSLEKMTFDWRVYDQSVWEVLNEICLYHRNTRPMIRLYNNDIYSTMDDLRESIVIGNKSGYYKFTDSFALSSMRVREIQELAEGWNNYIRNLVIDLINNIPAAAPQGGALPIVTPTKSQDILNGLKKSNFSYVKTSVRNGITYYYPDRHLIPILKFFRNRLCVTAMVRKILQNSEGIVPATITGFSIEYIRNAFPGIAESDNENLIRGLMGLATLGSIEDIKYEKLELGHEGGNKVTSVLDPVLSFMSFLKNEGFLNYFEQDGMLYELDASDLLNVDELIIDNTTNHLVNDPQYKKIQKHHLITDASDIISNNIVLSEDFKNAVSIYYLPEPKFYSGLSGIDHKDVTKLRSFTIKSFGDLRDSDTRLLESYQKNIDTNWFDVKNVTEDLLRGYARKKEEDFSEDKTTPSWDKLPTFVVTGLSLLQKEVEKMYRGTIQIVGNPNINPYDIVHIHDVVNDMNGPVEVDEVIHSFSPERGFTTTITPSLIAYDRDPVTMSDVETIGRIMDVADMKRNRARIRSGIILGASVFAATGGIGALSNASNSILARGVGGGLGGLGLLSAASSLYDILPYVGGIEKRYTRFIYDALANVFGRDCINFSALFYHGVPYMCGFDGVDYTNLKTLVNHQWQGLSTIQRLATAKDVEYKWLINNGDLGKQGVLSAFVDDAIPGHGPFWDVIAGSSFGKNTSNTFKGL